MTPCVPWISGRGDAARLTTSWSLPSCVSNCFFSALALPFTLPTERTRSLTQNLSAGLTLRLCFSATPSERPLITSASPCISSWNCRPRGSEVAPLSRMTVVSRVLLTLHSTFVWFLSCATIFSAQPVTPFTDTMASPCFNCNCGEALELKSVKGPSLNPITWSVASSRGSRSKPKEISQDGFSAVTSISAGSPGGRALPATFTFSLMKAWLTWASCNFSSPLKPFVA
mmetsp:Transcript_8481/g.26407  ORF Transcript_8481/g.26407 Transcript_8481/m.26407 type:complete len:228 (+) Transcript_8481:181-864(+)